MYPLCIFVKILNVNNIVPIEQLKTELTPEFWNVLCCTCFFFSFGRSCAAPIFSLKCLIYCKWSFLRFSIMPCYSQLFVTSFLFVILFCSTTYILIKYLRSMLLKLDPLFRKDSIYTSIMNT